jgi:hypothetical protein
VSDEVLSLWTAARRTARGDQRKYSDLAPAEEIACCDQTADDVGDSTILPDLLDQIETTVAQFIADGAYDGAPIDPLSHRLRYQSDTAADFRTILVPRYGEASGALQQRLAHQLRESEKRSWRYQRRL